MNWQLVFAPLISPTLIWLLAGLACLSLGFAAWRRAPALPVRVGAVLTLIALILNPTLQEEDREPIDDVAVLIVDDSTSMTLGDRPGDRDAALDVLTDRLGALPDMEVRIRHSRTGDDGGTGLFASAASALADVPPERVAGLMLLTDGQVHDVPASLNQFGFDIPVHALLVGDPNAPDRKLTLEQAPRFAIVGDEIEVRFRVDEAHTSSAQIPVTVKIDGTIIAELMIAPGNTTNLRLEVPHGGANIIELSAAESAGELTGQNNRATHVVNGIRDRLRVLLVSGEPHAGERTWRNLLKADPSVDLVHFTILRPPEKQDGTPIDELSLIAFPTRELFSVKLEEFDLIIFDRYRRRGVLPIIYLGNVARYVENGGAVLAAAGPAFATPYSIYRTPLAAILPAQPTGEIVEQAFRATLTEEGHRHPVTADLPGSASTPPDWGKWFRLIEAEATEGTSVMSGPDGRPLMVLNTVGEGRVAQLLSDHAWLWTRGYDGGGPQAELLRRLAHWLMKEPELEEEQLRAHGENGLLVIDRHTMMAQAGPVTVTLPSGATSLVPLTSVRPGRYQGTYASEEVGLHRVEDPTGNLSAVAAVGPENPKELEAVHATAEHIGAIVAESGGGLYWLHEDGVPAIRQVRPERDASDTNWMGLRRNGEYLLRAVTRAPLFEPLVALLISLGLLAWAWRREGA